jgi:hypothetical protein
MELRKDDWIMIMLGEALMLAIVLFLAADQIGAYIALHTK